MRHILVFLFFIVSLLCNGQHQSLNYVRTEHFLDSTGGVRCISATTYDGYGRVSYEIEPCGNGSYSASYTMYDNNSRNSGKWLPAPVSNIDNFDSDYDIEESGRSFYGNDDPCTWITYDSENRVVGSYAPGEYLRSNGICKHSMYGTNLSGSVRRYTKSGKETVFSGYYSPGSLNSELITDEDGKCVETFRDRLGRVILIRNGNQADTYYVYDNLGRLTSVISPQYEENNDQSLYCYDYEYDSRHRVISRRLPGCEETRYWYDDGDRVIYMQDARLRERGLYRFYFYDRLGRQVLQGTCSGFTDGGGNGFADYNGVDVSASLCGSGYVLVATQSVRNASLELCTYYDSYAFLSSVSIPSYVQNALAGLSGCCAKGLVTGTVTASSDGKLSYGIVYYDARGRNIATREYRSTGTVLTKRTSYTFTGSPSTVHHDILYSSGQHKTSLTEYVYSNNIGKLTDVYLTLDSGERHCITSLSYDKVGRLSGNTRGGNAGKISYSYNLHNQPVCISSPMFTEWLSYDDGPGTPLYNGSISSISWQSCNEDFRRGYKFDYDGMGRLLTGKYGEGVRLSDNTDRYTERVTGYDLNGSITGLQRYGKRDDSSFGLIDDLTVELDGNRVTSVTDRLANLQYNNAFEFHDEQGEGTEYTYDDCGSLTSDYNSGISSVEYDNVGMPRLTRFSKGSSIEYIYSATGDKLYVKYSIAVRDILLPRDSLIQRPLDPIIGTLSLNRNDDNLIPSIRDTFKLSQEQRYLGETIEYAGPFILHNGKPYMYLFDGGYCFYSSSATSSSSHEYFYYTKDHLGNNRIVVSENGELKQVTHYYPFGGVYGDVCLNSGVQPYKYNGKEFDHTHGLNWYDYGARMYSPALPLWTSMDPMSEDYYNLSPYVYCRNNPINYIDPNGKKSYLIFWDSTREHSEHAAFAIDNYKQVTLPDNTIQMVPDGTVTLYELFPNTNNYGVKEVVMNQTVQGQFLIYKKGTLKGIINNTIKTGENDKPDGVIKINSSYKSDMKAREVMKKEIESNKHYNIQTRNCSDFAKSGVEAASGEKIDYKIIMTPKKLYNNTKKIDGTQVIKSNENSFFKKYISF